MLAACGTLNQSSSRPCYSCAKSSILHLHPMHQQDRVCACVQAVPMQAYLLSMLGSGGALYELYSDVLTEPDITAEECVDYNALRAAADTLPGLCELCDAAHKPPLNPAQLLGVTFNATPEQVSLYACVWCWHANSALSRLWHGSMSEPDNNRIERRNDRKHFSVFSRCSSVMRVSQLFTITLRL